MLYSKHKWNEEILQIGEIGQDTVFFILSNTFSFILDNPEDSRETSTECWNKAERAKDQIIDLWRNVGFKPISGDRDKWNC